jgi:hypothetical protein
MGPAGKNSFPAGVYRDKAGKERETKTRSSNPLDLLNEVLVKAGLGATPEDARRAYDRMKPDAKTKFDKQHGLNEYAQPGVGDAFTTIRHPKFAKEKGWNFHWAGVIMAAGPDRVTFENVAVSEEIDEKNAGWFFELYGPRGTGSFHSQNKDSLRGDSAITMAARTKHKPGSGSDK